MNPRPAYGPERYEALDGLRGVAALAVVIFHLRAVNLAPDIAPHANLAVDFFFILSGFVIAHAYGDGLLSGMPWRLFAARRLIRLAPLALVGASIGLAGVILRWRLAPGHADPIDRILIAGALNLLMLPSFVSGAAYGYATFPGDGPLWSLFFEVVVNLAWAWIGVRLTIRQLAAFVVVAALVLAGLALQHGSTRMGVAAPTFWGGGARALFGFGLGVLLYRLRDRLPKTAWAGAPIAACAAIVIAFVAPLWLARGDAAGLVWDFAWIFILLPATVALAASRGQVGPMWRRLGELSYPVYVLHYPCLAALSGMRQRFLPLIDPGAVGVFAVGLVVSLSWAALKLFDEPVRRWLMRRLPHAATPTPSDAASRPEAAALSGGGPPSRS